MYLDRIEAYDKKGPNINAIVTVNPDALAEAERLDAAYKSSGSVGPLHGIPVIVKDQADVKGMPTTLGSVLFKEYFPDRDSFVAEKLKNAGAVILGKATLGELGGGDTHGSLFGSTRNPYDTERTVGGSSGGSAAVGFGELLDGRRGPGRARLDPQAVYMERHHGHAALRRARQPRRRVRLLAGGLRFARADGAHGKRPGEAFGHDGRLRSRRSDHRARRRPHSGKLYKFLSKDGLKGARLGILRESIGLNSEPDSEDYKKIQEVFDRAVGELRPAGAEIVDPIVIPKIKELLAKRAGAPGETKQSFANYYGRSAKPPFQTPQEAAASADFAKVVKRSQERFKRNPDAAKHYESLKAQDELMTCS